MNEENNQAGGAAVAERLRDVPANITEYQKFVAEGGNEHNDKILAREAAEKAARAAGLAIASGEDEQHKPHKNGFQARVSRLQRRIGERDQRIADLEKRLSAQPNGQPTPAKPDAAAPAAEAAKPEADDKTPPRPKEADFKTYSEFVEALTDWKTDRKFEASEMKRSETRQQAVNEEKNKAIEAAHNARVDEAKTRYDDFAEAFDGLPDNAYSPVMYQFIFESDKGPEISYYLAKHRKELARLRELPDLKQAAALGRIEDRFTETKEETGDDDEGETEGEDKKTAPAKPAKAAKAAAPADGEDDEDDEDEEKKPAARRSVQSRAPAPAKPLGGRGGADDAMPDPKNFVEYEKWSLRQQAKAKKR